MNFYVSWFEYNFVDIDFFFFWASVIRITLDQSFFFVVAVRSE